MMFFINTNAYKKILVGLLILSFPVVFFANVPPTATVPLQSPISCTPAALIAAITQANNGTGSSIIRLASHCVYVLRTELSGSNGLPVITGNIQLIGGKNTIISRSQTSPTFFRFFEIALDGRLTLKNIRLDNGNVSGSGGGIFALGILETESVLFSHNLAGSGGAIRSGSNSDVKITNSTFLFNQATASLGGAIFSRGILNIQDSRFVDNIAQDSGGALDVQGPINTINHSQFYYNVANTLGGGAIFNFLTQITIRNSIIRFNTSNGSPTSGGGIATSSLNSGVTLINTIVTDNTPKNCSPPGVIAGCTD